MTSWHRNTFLINDPLGITHEFPSNWPVIWSFVFFVVSLKKLLNKSSNSQLFETLLCSCHITLMMEGWTMVKSLFASILSLKTNHDHQAGLNFQQKHNDDHSTDISCIKYYDWKKPHKILVNIWVCFVDVPHILDQELKNTGEMCSMLINRLSIAHVKIGECFSD